MNDKENGQLALVIETALTFATFASFALPPPAGFVVGGVLASMNLVISRCAGSPGDGRSFMAGLSAQIAHGLDDHEIQECMAGFSSYARWLNEFDLSAKVPFGLKEGGDAMAFAQFMNFYKNLQAAVTNPGDPLRQSMEKLQREDAVERGESFETRSLASFLYGASVFAALSKIYISVNSTAYQKNDRFSIGVLMAELSGFIDHADKVFSYVEEERAKRMEKISAMKMGLAAMKPFMDEIKTVDARIMEDSEEFYPRPAKQFDLDDSWLGANYIMASSRWMYINQGVGEQAEKDAEVWRQKYLKDSSDLFERFFFGEHKDSMLGVVEELKKTLRNYQKIYSFLGDES